MAFNKIYSTKSLGIYKYLYTLGLIFYYSAFSCHAQSNDNTTLEGLIKQYLSVNETTVKAGLALQIGKNYQEKEAFLMANNYLKEAVQLKEKTGAYTDLPKIFNEIGNNFIRLNLYDDATEAYRRSVKFSKKYDIHPMVIVGLNKLANAQSSLKDYHQAIKTNNEILLNEGTDIGPLEKATIYNNIGVLYQELNENVNAGYYLGKADSIIQILFESDKLKDFIAQNIWIATNLATTHTYLQNSKEAVTILEEVLTAYQKSDDSLTIGSLYNFLGAVQHVNYENDAAFSSIEKAIMIGEKLNSNQLLADSYKILAEIYTIEDDFEAAQKATSSFLAYEKVIKQQEEDERARIADLQLQFQEEDARIKNQIQQEQRLQLELEQAKLAAEKQVKELELQQEQLNLLKSNEALKASQLEKEALERESVEQALLIAKNELYRIKKEEEILQLQKEKELQQIQEEKRQEQLKTLEAEKKLKEQELEQNKQIQKYGWWILILIFCIVILLTLAVIQGIRSRKALSQNNKVLNETNDELSITLDTISSQKEEIEKQKIEIEHSHKHITDSINYARRIQEAVLPSTNIIENSIPDHFILFRPRDVVSGDFYWYKKYNEYIILAAADCTGHGVPGAFMSMLGTSFLNEIVQKEGVVRPSKILDLLRDEIKSALKQTGKLGEQQDGMDIALCVIDTGTGILEYSGAHNPLFILNNKTTNKERFFGFEGNRKVKLTESEDTDNSILEIGGDYQPIGIFRKEKPFNNYCIELSGNDTIYIFSDGFVDQIGGKERKKFMTRNFKQLLLKIAEQNIKEQKHSLEKTLSEWQGDSYKQVDDILVIGVKFDASSFTKPGFRSKKSMIPS